MILRFFSLIIIFVNVTFFPHFLRQLNKFQRKLQNRNVQMCRFFLSLSVLSVLWIVCEQNCCQRFTLKISGLKLNLTTLWDSSRLQSGLQHTSLRNMDVLKCHFPSDIRLNCSFKNNVCTFCAVKYKQLNFKFIKIQFNLI